MWPFKKKKAFSHYCLRNDIIQAWQMSDDNLVLYELPDFIEELIKAGRFKIVTAQAGEQRLGKIIYRAHVNPNRSDHDVEELVFQGDWVVRFPTGIITKIGNREFQAYYVGIKEDKHGAPVN
jgi:hypothetical protein